MRILIVDDDFFSRKLLCSILGKYGECDVAMDGTEAVEAFRAAQKQGKPYDLLCMDIMMPHMDGHEALARIREMEKVSSVLPSDKVKAIFTTAVDEPSSVRKAHQDASATAYLVKPIDKKVLLDVMERLLKNNE